MCVFGVRFADLLPVFYCVDFFYIILCDCQQQDMMILRDRTRVAKSGNSISDRKFKEIASYTTV